MEGAVVKAMDESLETFYIAGDICPTASNASAFDAGDVQALFSDELISAFNHSRGLIFNLETALSNTPEPVIKSGPCLIASEGCVRTLASLNPICASAANNHITDSGSSGFERTVAALKSAGIPYCGIGSGIEEMTSQYVFEMADKSYAIYSCAEHEFTICASDHPGANPFDPSQTFDDIATLANTCDRVIVLYHGMKEHYQYPSPEVVQRCRMMVDSGAFLVCCQHSHCIGCVEEYGNGTVLYGQGNFSFAREGKDEKWETGLLVSVSSGDRIDYIPVRTRAEGTRILPEEEASRVLAEFMERSKQIEDPEFIKEKWKEYCDEIADSYAMQLLKAIEPRWISFLARGLRRLHVIKPRLATGQDSAALLNLLQCEAHNEVLRTYLRMHLDD